VTATTHPDPRLVDAVLALAMALSVAVLIAANFDAEGRPDAAAYFFAVVFGVLVALRRVAPRAMLVLTLLAIFVYYPLGFPPIGTALPAAAALYSAAEMDRTRWAVGAGAVLIAVSGYFRVEDGLPLSYLYGYEMLTNVALAAAAIALGAAVRLTHKEREHAERVRMLTEAEQAREAERRLQEERVRIARDLHDVVGHNLSVISLHSGVAAEAVGRDDAKAREALDQVREATSGTLRDLRATVAVLRRPARQDGPRDSTGPAGIPGLAGVVGLVRPARAAGLTVEVDVEVESGTLDAAIDAAAYRIVQESLTNVLRHAEASRATVSARVEEDRLRLRVVDDGRGSGRDAGCDAEEPRPEGRGIAGMRERATLLGGHVEAGPAPDGGFAVAADLPVTVGR
jgi:signal transduction histidine kinase